MAQQPRHPALVAAVAIVGIAATMIGDGWRGLNEALAFLAFFSVAFPVGFVRYTLRAHARKLLATAPNVQGPQHVAFSDDGTVAHDAVWAWTQHWTAFRGYRLLATTVSLNTSDQSFYLVPGAALEPGELELITSHLPDLATAADRAIVQGRSADGRTHLPVRRFETVRAIGSRARADAP